jgi:hypothetical protein
MQNVTARKKKQNNYEKHEIEDRTCTADRKIEYRSAKGKAAKFKCMHIVITLAL